MSDLLEASRACFSWLSMLWDLITSNLITSIIFLFVLLPKFFSIFRKILR